MNPLVSVIVPAFNAHKTIKESIDSVLSQSHTNFELLIADDGSTDSTADIVKSYSDNRIIYLYQKQIGNTGAGSARNLAISFSNGDYIAFLDSDDLWHPDKLRIQLRCFHDTPEADLVYSSYYCFSDSYSRLKVGDTYAPSLFRSELYNLLIKNYLPILTVIVKTSAIKKVGLFRSMPGVEDWDLWLRLSRTHKFRFINIPLAYYRLSKNSMSSNRLSHLRYEYQLVDEYIVSNSQIPTIVSFAALAFLEAKRFKYIALNMHVLASLKSLSKLFYLLLKIFPLTFAFFCLLIRTSAAQLLSFNRYRQ